MNTYYLFLYCVLSISLEAIVVVLLSYCKRSVVCILQFESLFQN